MCHPELLPVAGLADERPLRPQQRAVPAADARVQPRPDHPAVPARRRLLHRPRRQVPALAGPGRRGPPLRPWTYFKGGYENVYMNFDGTVRRSQGYSTTIVFDRAIDYVDDFERRDDARPFYLYLAPIAPHDPSIAEPKYASAAVPAHQPDPSYMEADRSDKPPFVRNQNPTAATVQATRAAMIRTLYTVDDQVDRFLRHLQTTGELANTLVPVYQRQRLPARRAQGDQQVPALPQGRRGAVPAPLAGPGPGRRGRRPPGHPRRRRPHDPGRDRGQPVACRP